jgi:hypothetical protein
MTTTYEGSCFCGAIQIAATGEPVAEGYCHCASCRSWSAAPVNAFTLWKPESVKVVKGGEYLRGFRKTERSDRKFCNLCGGHVMTQHPGFGLVDVYAATIPAHPHAPTLHVHYGEHVMPMHDGLPKFLDLPGEMGGSGMLCAE